MRRARRAAATARATRWRRSPGLRRSGAMAGYAPVARADDADVIVVNTCAVREKAEDRVIARASELAAIKRRRPGAVLAIVGCMAEHLKDGLAARAPAVDVIAGPDSYRRLP